MGKISNITNSSEPQAVNSRIFVGNVNTFALSKDDVEAVFKRYGNIIGISMHKGYAFIQYTNEVESRNAVTGEDQRMYAGQQIDVNLAAEPKPNRPNRKRPNGAGSEWDYYYNVPFVPGSVPLQVPLAKRPRPDLVPPPLAPIMSPASIIPQINKQALVQFSRNNYIKVASPFQRKPQLSGSYKSKQDESDILICGVCKQRFPDLEKLTSHKRIRCKLRFVCRCENDDTVRSEKDGPAEIVCATCSQVFSSCWELCQHCQQEHRLNIYAVSAIHSSSESCSVVNSNSGHATKEVEATAAITTSAPTSSLVLLNSTDRESDHEMLTNHDNGLSSPGSGSLSSDISSVDINENATTNNTTKTVKDASLVTIHSITQLVTATTGRDG